MSEVINYRIESPRTGTFNLYGVTLSYADWLWKASSFDNDPNATPRYQATCLIPKQMDINPLMEYCYGLFKENLKEKADEELKRSLAALEAGGTPQVKWPIRKDNRNSKTGAPWFDSDRFTFWLRPSAQKPGFTFDRYADPNDRSETPEPMKITQPVEGKLYSGAVINVSINVVWFPKAGRPAIQGNRGVTCYINTVQHWADGPRLDNIVPAASQFQGEKAVSVDLGALVSPPPMVGQPPIQPLVQPATGARASALNDLLRSN